MKRAWEKWIKRHSHPINAVLHIIGIPMTFVGGYIAFSVNILLGLAVFVLGYVVQFIGHWIEGSEIGELMLFKHIGNKLFGKK